jgi:pimeloyl-ACP methyl ester carboxylesterase
MNTNTTNTVEYQESGNGEAIVFVPGSFSAGSSWRTLTALLFDRYRTITTSLSGYGKTQERIWSPIHSGHGPLYCLPFVAQATCCANH